MKKFIDYNYPVISLIVFFTISCNIDEPVSVYNPELVFPEAFEVRIPAYSYTDSISGLSFLVKGGSIADTLSNLPVFQWEKFSTGLYSVAISDAPINVENGTIVNLEAIIWQWHTTMEEESILSDGIHAISVAYEDGRKVFNKKISYQTQPLPLESGLYFWMVWGWDKTGKGVIYSSRQKSFIVE